MLAMMREALSSCEAMIAKDPESTVAHDESSSGCDLPAVCRLRSPANSATSRSCAFSSASRRTVSRCRSVVAA